MLQQAPLLRAVAQQMIEQALAESAAGLELPNALQVLELLRRGNCDPCEAVRLNLARQVAAHLAAADPDTRAIYWFDPESATGEYEQVGTCPSSSSTLNLMAWTRTKKASFANAAQALREALLDARSEILCPQAEGCCFDLEVTVIDDVQVAAHSEGGALLDSIWVRPVQLWSSEGAAINSGRQASLTT